MTDYLQFAKATRSLQGAGERPPVRDYFWMKVAENWLFALLIVVLVLLMLGFAYIGLFIATDNEKSKWALNAASLCLGVFLGLFAGRRL